MSQGAFTTHSGTKQNILGALLHVTQKKREREGKKEGREGGSDSQWVSSNTCYTEHAKEMLGKGERGRGRKGKQEDVGERGELLSGLGKYLNRFSFVPLIWRR